MNKLRALVISLALACTAAFGQDKLDPADKAEIDEATKAIATSPTAYNYRERARLYLHSNMYSQCQSDATRAIALDPKSARAWFICGAARCGLKNFNDGLKDLDKALSLSGRVDNTYIATLQARAYCYYHLGRTKEAYRDRQTLVELGAESPAVLKDDSWFQD